MFGEFVREKRLEAGLEYLKFSNQVGIDPVAWNKIERGISKPPSDIGMLKVIAETLGIRMGSPAWLKLVVYSVQDQKRVPKLSPDDASLRDMLPVFCRSKNFSQNSVNDVVKLKQVIKKAQEA